MFEEDEEIIGIPNESHAPTTLSSDYGINPEVEDIDRMDRIGARWGLPGSESILKLRSLVSNGDFEYIFGEPGFPTDERP